MKEMEEKLDGFTYGQKQNLLTLILVLERNGWSIDDFKSFMGQHKSVIEIYIKPNTREYYIAQKATDRMTMWADKGEKCLVCGTPLRLFDVNTNPANQIGGNYKTHLMCANVSCDYERYTEKTMEEILKDYGIIKE